MNYKNNNYVMVIKKRFYLYLIKIKKLDKRFQFYIHANLLNYIIRYSNRFQIIYETL